MEFLAWPGAILLLGIVFLAVFFRPITRLIDRIKRVGIGRSSVEAEATPPQQTAVEPRDPRMLPTAGGEPSARLRTEDLLRDYASPMIMDRDREIRLVLDRLETQADREKILIRYLAGLQVYREFERTYYAIYGSQIMALADLNSAGVEGLPVARIRMFYDNAAATNPDAYENYTFDQWVGFLKLNNLVRETQNGLGLGIAPMGHEFLIHLPRSRLPILKSL